MVSCVREAVVEASGCRRLEARRSTGWRSLGVTSSECGGRPLTRGRRGGSRRSSAQGKFRLEARRSTGWRSLGVTSSACGGRPAGLSRDQGEEIECSRARSRQAVDEQTREEAGVVGGAGQAGAERGAWLPTTKNFIRACRTHPASTMSFSVHRRPPPSLSGGKGPRRTQNSSPQSSRSSHGGVPYPRFSGDCGQMRLTIHAALEANLIQRGRGAGPR